MPLIIILFLSLPYEILHSMDEYFLTLRNDKVNLRQGPSFDYPVKIFYKKKFLPVLIQDKSDNFRKVRDHENNSGWIHISQLSRTRSTVTTKNNQVIFSSPTIFSKPKAKLEIYQVLIISECTKNWCKVKNSKINGWIKKNHLWGIQKDEIIKK